MPILRAGLGMVDTIIDLVPSAKVGHIGLFRDPETHEPVKYYCKMPPDISERQVFVVDPMLATGGSAADAITFIKEYGCKSITLMNIIAAPEGIKKVQETIPTWTFSSLLWIPASTTMPISSRPGRRWRPHLRHEVKPFGAKKPHPNRALK